MAQYQELGLPKFDDITKDLGNPAHAIVTVLELIFQFKNFFSDSSILFNMLIWDHLMMTVTYLFGFYFCYSQVKLLRP